MGDEFLHVYFIRVINDEKITKDASQRILSCLLCNGYIVYNMFSYPAFLWGALLLPDSSSIKRLIKITSNVGACQRIKAI